MFDKQQTMLEKQKGLLNFFNVLRFLYYTYRHNGMTSWTTATIIGLGSLMWHRRAPLSGSTRSRSQRTRRGMAANQTTPATGRTALIWWEVLEVASIFICWGGVGSTQIVLSALPVGQGHRRRDEVSLEWQALHSLKPRSMWKITWPDKSFKSEIRGHREAFREDRWDC